MSFITHTKKTSFTIAIVVALFAQCKKSNPKWELTFSDEFSGTSLNRSIWKTNFDWGQSFSDTNQEFRIDSAIVIKDGMLHIIAKRDTVIGTVYDENFNPVPKTFYFTSGLIHSQYGFAQQYGYFEMRSKAPFGKGFWPAFWLFPYTGGNFTETDIFEICGQEPEGLHMSNHFKNGQGLHSQSTTTVYGPDLTKDFHVFAIEWNPKEILWYLDNKVVYSTQAHIPNERMYLIIDLYIGGYFCEFADNTTPFPASFDVDYVRVYKRSGS